MRKQYQKPSFEIRNAQVGPHGPTWAAKPEEPLVQLRRGRGKIIYSGMHWHPAERFTEVPAEELIRRTRGKRLKAVGTVAAMVGTLALPVSALTTQIRSKMIENLPFRISAPSFETSETYLSTLPTAFPISPRFERVARMQRDAFRRSSLARGYQVNIEPPAPSLHKLDWELRQKLATMLAVEVGFANPTPEVYSRVLNSVKVRAQQRFDREDAKRRDAGLQPLTEKEKLPVYHEVLDPDEYQGLSPENLRKVREEDPETSRRWNEKLAEAGKFVDENWGKPIDPEKDGAFFYTTRVRKDRTGGLMFDDKGRPILERARIPSDWDARHVSTTVWTPTASDHRAIVVAKPKTPTPKAAEPAKTPSDKK